MNFFTQQEQKGHLLLETLCVLFSCGCGGRRSIFLACMRVEVSALPLYNNIKKKEYKEKVYPTMWILSDFLSSLSYNYSIYNFVFWIGCGIYMYDMVKV